MAPPKRGRAKASRTDFLAKKEAGFLHRFEDSLLPTEELEALAATLGRGPMVAVPETPQQRRRWACSYLAWACATTTPLPCPVPEPLGV